MGKIHITVTLPKDANPSIETLIEGNPMKLFDARTDVLPAGDLGDITRL